MKKMKSILTMILTAVVLVLGILPVSAFADDGYNEVIVMADDILFYDMGAYLDELEKMITDLASCTFAEDPETRFTIMSYGINGRNHGIFDNVADIEKHFDLAMSEALGYNYVRKYAANVERAFEYVDEYISSSENLNKAAVIFISDGLVSLDETPFDWTKWKDENEFPWNTDGGEPWTWSATAWEFMLIEADYAIWEGADPLPSTARVAPELAAAVIAARDEYGIESPEHIAAMGDLLSDSNTKSDIYFESFLKAAFEEYGIDWNEKQPASAVHNAVKQYISQFSDRDEYIKNMYTGLVSMVLGRAGVDRCPDRIDHAASACESLLENDKLAMLYNVGYGDGVNSWMNPDNGYISENSKLCTAFGEKLEDIELTAVMAENPCTGESFAFMPSAIGGVLLLLGKKR